MNLMKLRHTKKGTQKALYNKELRDELIEYLKDHLEYQQDTVEKLFSKENWRMYSSFATDRKSCGVKGNAELQTASSTVTQ